MMKSFEPTIFEKWRVTRFKPVLYFFENDFPTILPISNKLVHASHLENTSKMPFVLLPYLPCKRVGGSILFFGTTLKYVPSVPESLSFLKNEDSYEKNATHDRTNHMVKNDFK